VASTDSTAFTFFFVKINTKPVKGTDPVLKETLISLNEKITAIRTPAPLTMKKVINYFMDDLMKDAQRQQQDEIRTSPIYKTNRKPLGVNNSRAGRVIDVEMLNSEEENSDEESVVEISQQQNVVTTEPVTSNSNSPRQEPSTQNEPSQIPSSPNPSPPNPSPPNPSIQNPTPLNNQQTPIVTPLDQSDQVLQIIKDQQQLVNQLFLQLTQEKGYSAMLRMEANNVFNFQHKKIQEQQNQLQEEREQHLLNYDTLFNKANATAIQQQTKLILNLYSRVQNWNYLNRIKYFIILFGKRQRRLVKVKLIYLKHF